MVSNLPQQSFMYKGERVRRMPETHYAQWIAGVDLGQRQDYTAISAIEHTRTPLDEWVHDKRSGRLRQQAEQRYAVRGLQRFPLNLDYIEQARRLRQLLIGPPLREQADLVMDDTGVGGPVGDLVAAHGQLRPVRVTITAGAEVTRLAYRKYAVPKIELISQLDARLNAGELIFADGLALEEVAADELANFQRHVTAAGRSTFEARASKHDDIVLSIALAVWWANMKRRINCGSVGPLRGLF